MSETPAPVQFRKPPRGWPLALLGFLLALAAIPAYALTMDHAGLRRTGIAAFAFFGAGSALALVAWRRGRWGTRTLSSLTLLLSGLFTGMFFFATRLPAATTIQTASVAPDFTLPDQMGRPVSLRSVREKDRALLIFYRGHW